MLFRSRYLRVAAVLGTVIVVATAILAQAPGAIAQATPEPNDRALFFWEFEHAEGGALGTFSLMQRASDRAVYYLVTIQDTGADGVCAHATIGWDTHGPGYAHDFGMWSCGEGNMRSFTTEARDPAASYSTTPAIFVDGGFQRSEWTTDRTYAFDCWCTTG